MVLAPLTVDGWTDGRTDTDGRIGGWTYGEWTDGWADGQKEGRPDGWADGRRMDGRLDGQTEGRVDGWVERRVDGRMERWCSLRSLRADDRMGGSLGFPRLLI